MSPPMLRDIFHRCLRAVLVLAFLAPLSPAAASPVAGANIFCAPSGHVSPEAAAALDDLRKALGFSPIEAPTNDSQCDNCVLVAALKARPLIYVPAKRSLVEACYEISLNCGFAYSAQGPPLGSRAPPISV